MDEYIAGDNYYSNWRDCGTRTDVRYEWRIIGFCGRAYVLLIEFTKVAGTTDRETAEYYYGDECLEQVFSGTLDRWRYKETKDFIAKWHNHEHIDFFYENKVPIFAVEPSQVYKGSADVVLNPNLSEIKFFKLFNSYTAFQEIQMFISGVIGINTSNAIEINDKNKVIQHGFDAKWSFRNPDPPKRKQK